MAPMTDWRSLTRPVELFLARGVFHMPKLLTRGQRGASHAAANAGNLAALAGHANDRVQMTQNRIVVDITYHLTIAP